MPPLARPPPLLAQEQRPLLSLLPLLLLKYTSYILTHSQNVPPIMAARTPPKIHFIYILVHSRNDALFMFLLLLLKHTSCSLILTPLAAPTPLKIHFQHPPNLTHSQYDFVAINGPDCPNLPSASLFLIYRCLQGVASCYPEAEKYSKAMC